MERARSDERELLRSALEEIEDLPEGLASRLLRAIEDTAEDRSDAIRRVIEEAVS